MCKRLSERGADDLLAFAQYVMRTGAYAERSGSRSISGPMGERARKVLAKHGLLTPADDPEVAAVFMEEGPQDRATDAKPLYCRHCGWGDHGTAYHRPGLHGLPIPLPLLRDEGVKPMTEHMLTVPAELVRGDRNYVLRATKAMPADGISAGDYLIVAPRVIAQPGEMVIVTLGEGVSMMRRYHPEGDVVRLEGPEGSEAHPAELVHIHGVVSGVIRKY